MEVRKFKKFHYDEEEENTFVKAGAENWEFCIASEPGSMNNFAAVRRNGIKISGKWNEVMKFYQELKLGEVKPERTYNYESHFDDEDDTAEDNFDAAVEAARDWLYA